MKPVEKGWYAVLWFWDVNEGIFSGGLFWDREKFNDTVPVSDLHGPFASKEQAEEWAELHNFDNGPEYVPTDLWKAYTISEGATK